MNDIRHPWHRLKNLGYDLEKEMFIKMNIKMDDIQCL